MLLSFTRAITVQNLVLLAKKKSTVTVTEVEVEIVALEMNKGYGA